MAAPSKSTTPSKSTNAADAATAVERAANAQRPAAAKRAWRKVEAQAEFATRWQPVTPGEKLEGLFTGLRRCKGADGEFKIGEITGPNDEKFSVSGYALINALASVEPGSAVVLTFRGVKQLPRGRTLKEYDVETDSPEFTPMDDSDIPF